MLENLKLPLCPKCGNTKNVKDKNDYSQCIIHQPNHECLSCNISWTPYKLVDHNTNQVYDCRFDRGGVLGQTLVRENEFKWWRTLTENIRSV